VAAQARRDADVSTSGRWRGSRGLRLGVGPCGIDFRQAGPGCRKRKEVKGVGRLGNRAHG
jgi:hypothetical protein